jgi:hypothetical protein
MTPESIEQLKAKLKKQDEEKEEAFQKRLQEIREAQAPWRAEQEAKKRAEEQERKKLLDDARRKRENEMRDGAEDLDCRRRDGGRVRGRLAFSQDGDAQAPYPRGRRQRARIAETEWR